MVLGESGFEATRPGGEKRQEISRPSGKYLLTAAPTPFHVPLIVNGASQTHEEVHDIKRPVDDGLFIPGLLRGESRAGQGWYVFDPFQTDLAAIGNGLILPDC